MIDYSRGFTLTVYDSVAELSLLEHYDPDLHGCEWAEAVVERMPPDCNRVVVDMGGYNRVDSRLFTGLIQIHRHMRDLGVNNIVLRAVGPRVRVGLDMLRLTPFFNFEHRSDSPSAIRVG